MCVRTTYAPDAHKGEKKESDSRMLELGNGCEPSCGCWEPNPSPLQEQPVLLTTELSLQPPVILKNILKLAEFLFPSNICSENLKLIAFI